MPGQQQDFAAPYKDGRPRRKAAQEGKAAKDTEDPLDPPSCSGTCSKRKEVAFGAARIIRVGS